jgi:hypothetical protein
MPEKRGQAKSASRTPRETRVVWPKLDCLKSNPDRDKRSPVARLAQRDVTVCRGFVFCPRQTRAVRYREMIPGVGMSGRPNPCSDVRRSETSGSPVGREPHGDGVPVVCAGQRLDPEGSSPSAARMRGGVSKDGGNASSAGEHDHGEPYTGTKSETTDTAKGMHLQSSSVREDNQRAGCPPRGGIRKACGEVPGRNRGEPSP